MTAPTVEVTAKLSSFGGPALAGIVITAIADKDDNYDGLILRKQITATTDTNGDAVFDLFPNALATAEVPGLGTTGSTYRFTASVPNGWRLDVKAQVPNLDCDLHTIVMSDDEDAPMPGEVAGAVRYNIAQTLTSPQKAQARTNIGVAGVAADIGAVGDGVTDDTTAVSAAIAAGRQLPPGTFLVSTITFQAGAQIVGSGAGKTTLKLKANTNADVLVSQSAYTWFGNTSAAGTDNWRIEGITIDGNATNQSTGTPNTCNGLAYYSSKHTLRDVVIKNVKGHGIRSEGPQYGEDEGGIDPFASNVTIDNVGRHGWWNNGPHDLHAENVVVSDASQETDNTWCGLYNDTYSGGRFFNFHAWHRSTATNRMQYACSSLGSSEYVASHFEGGRKQFQHRGSGDRMIGCLFYGHYGAAGTALVSIEGQLNQHKGCWYAGTNGTSMYAIEFKNSAALNQIDGYFQNFDISSPFLFTSDGGINRINGIGYSATGGATTFGGTMAATTQVHYDQGGTNITSRPTTLVPAGSAATPGLAFVGDEDTGIARTASNTWAAIVGGAVAATFAAGGVSATTFTGALTGNASTATTLATARNINGVSFNGSADITVTAAAGTLTGATLAAGVTASSLTSVGTLTALTVSGVASFADGSAAAPSVRVGTTDQSGLYAAANVLDLSVAGVRAVQFTRGPSAVNYFVISAQTSGVGPFLNVAGANTDISPRYRSKGAGGHIFETGGSGNNALVLTHVASSVNSLDLRGSATGNAVTIATAGSDTDRGITITPGGAGVVTVAGISSHTGQAIFAAGSAGAPSVKVGAEQNGLYSSAANRLDLVAGGVRQAQVVYVASAVNFLSFYGAATGGGPTMYADGSDAAVNFNHSLKGAGSHVFYTGSTANIQVVIPHTAGADRWITLTGSNGGNPTIGVSGGSLAITPNVVAAGTVTVSGQASFTDGSAAAPSVKIGDEQNGFYSDGAGSLSVATAGARVVRFGTVGGTGNYLRLDANNTPLITAVAGATNADIGLVSAGTGAILLATNGSIATTQVRVSHVASAVNYWDFTGAGTGSGIRVDATGSDSGVNGFFVAKGSGVWNFCTSGSSSNRQFQIGHIASAVNYLNLTGGATGNAVTISTGGSDTNRSISLTAAGTGLVQITNDSLRIVTSKTPASATATGTQGQVAWDASYIYVCTATDTWKRAAIATW